METRRWLRAVVVDLHMVVVLMIDLKCWCCCLIEIMRRRLRSSVSVMVTVLLVRDFGLMLSLTVISRRVLALFVSSCGLELHILLCFAFTLMTADSLIVEV